MIANLLTILRTQFDPDTVQEVLVRMLALPAWPRDPLRYARRIARNLRVSEYRRKRVCPVLADGYPVLTNGRVGPEQERRAIARMLLKQLPTDVLNTAFWQDIPLTPTQRTRRRRAVKRLLLTMLLLTGCASGRIITAPAALEAVREVRAVVGAVKPNPPEVRIRDDIPGAGLYEIDAQGLAIIYVRSQFVDNFLALRVILGHEFAHWLRGHNLYTCGSVPRCEHDANITGVYIIERTWPRLNARYLMCLWVKGAANVPGQGHDGQWEYQAFLAHFNLTERTCLPK